MADFSLQGKVAVVTGGARGLGLEMMDALAEAWRRLLDVNSNGVFYCAQAAGRAMIVRGGGSIILIASMSGQIVNKPQKQAAYNGSKAGVIMLARSLAAEWAPHGIRVNALAPGYSLQGSQNGWRRQDALRGAGRREAGWDVVRGGRQ